MSELVENQENLATLAIKNQNEFKEEINNIIKNRLIQEIKTRIEEISGDIINDFKIELSTINIESFELNQEWIEKITQGIKILLSSTQQGFGKLYETTKGKSGTIYKTVTTILGITTTVLNPLLEIVIIFLPEIIEFFTKNIMEERAKKEFLDQFHYKVIPSLKIKLRQTLQTLMQEQVEKLVMTISNQFEEELKQKKDEIEKTMKEKDKDVFAIKEKIEKLEKIKSQIQTMANQYIFKG